MNFAETVRTCLVNGRFDLPLPGGGSTPQRHRALADIAREDLSLARIAEAHADAVAILAEAGRPPVPGALYGVWASETSRQALRIDWRQSWPELNGIKSFCTGAGIVDRALVTVTVPEHRLIDVDLRANSGSISFDASGWITDAFRETCTAAAQFFRTPVDEADFVGPVGWYLKRTGFWQGACGPAACWAGGAIALVEYALKQTRNDPHTLAHLGAMGATAWELWSCLESAGREIDARPQDGKAAQTTALIVRHLIEQGCRDILTRFARAYGPRPLAFEEGVSRRCREVELYIRQSHAERDLEALGNCLHAA